MIFGAGQGSLGALTTEGAYTRLLAGLALIEVQARRRAGGGARLDAPGGYEVQVAELKLAARAEPDLPVPVNQDPEKLSLEAVLDHRMVSISPGTCAGRVSPRSRPPS